MAQRQMLLALSRYRAAGNTSAAAEIYHNRVEAIKAAIKTEPNR